VFFKLLRLGKFGVGYGSGFFSTERHQSFCLHQTKAVHEREQRVQVRKDEKRWRNKQKNVGKKGSTNRIVLLSTLIVIAVAGLYAALSQHQSSDIQGIKVGDLAPDIPITLVNGTSASLSSFRGQVVLLWFVTTWCTGCQQGAELISQQYLSELNRAGVTVLTVESYDNLGYPGPSMLQFADEFAGGINNPRWLFGFSTQQATYTFNPQADLDIYYLIDPSGKIITTGSGLAAQVQQVIADIPQG
jgi:cytochrome oxidase Cu insertion factor (SCO1/SenC/PrrC family)